MKIFKTVREGINWLEENLNLSFPYEEVNLIFVPELKTLGQSSCLNILLDDDFISKKLNEIDETFFHYLIIHQLAHSFFGNSTTPTWFDDIWLSTSISCFLAYLCLKLLSERV